MNEKFRQVMERISKMRGAYRSCFLDGKTGQMTRGAEIVMADLRSFCRATSTPAQLASNGMVDPIATGIAIGRLEVWHRFAQNLHISDADLYRMVEQSEKERDQQ